MRVILILMAFCCLAACTRTVKKSFVERDTLEVVKNTADTSSTRETLKDTVYIARTDTVRLVDVRRDSTLRRDSVFVRERGESVYVYKERWNTTVITSHDTVLKLRTDTLRMIVRDTVETLAKAERTDTITITRYRDRETVKESPRVWKWWIVGLAAVVGALLWWWRKK